ncbi:MAG TPA: hypothetical protein VMU25_01495 [Candidatus Paceibacterota bacterium]|nr:hypothetical protein [Candidatus Paceibacterota bacterium]
MSIRDVLLGILLSITTYTYGHQALDRLNGFVNASVEITSYSNPSTPVCVQFCTNRNASPLPWGGGYTDYTYSDFPHSDHPDDSGKI